MYIIQRKYTGEKKLIEIIIKMILEEMEVKHG